MGCSLHNLKTSHKTKKIRRQEPCVKKRILCSTRRAAACPMRWIATKNCEAGTMCKGKDRYSTVRAAPCAVHAAGGRRPAEDYRNPAEGAANLAE